MNGDTQGRGRLAEYIPWIARDYFTNQGPSTALVVLLIAYLSLLPVLQGAMGPEIEMGDVPEPVAKRVLQALITPFVFLGTFFATNGIIANDRKLNYYRFLFAKPISPLAYYSMIFAVYGAGLVVVAVLLMGVWAFAVRPMLPGELFVIVPVMYLAYGGIGFLLSAAWRFDWISLVTVLLGANVAWTVFGDTTGPLRVLLYLLPPVHQADAVQAMDFGPDGGAVPWMPLVWLSGYGAACYLLGLVVLRKRDLGSS
jgi:ABC-type multidrug transport system permease subunit